MRTLSLFLLGAALASAQPRTQTATDLTVNYELFRNPPAEYRGHRWFTWNLSTITEERMLADLRRAAESHAYGSFMITPGNGSTAGLSQPYLEGSRRKPSTEGIAYLSEDYFRLYRRALEEGERLGFPARVLYDELQYPTGMAGGQLYSKYPEAAAKSLELVERNVTGPAKVALDIPLATGIYFGAVLLNRTTHEVIDVSPRGSAKGLACDVPAGEWKAMLFYLDPTFRPASWKGGFVDYLDAPSVDKFIALTFDAYYAHLKPYFGTQIRMTFYDEPAMHMSNSRMWTPGFNQAFASQYGYSPMKLYPALWYDIGPTTAAARNALFGFRARLYAENFVGRMAKWAAAHGVDLSGHQDQEEVRNPTGIHGDLMKVFEHQQIPGIDDIYYTGRTNAGYKIVTSSAFNWDKPLVMAETYAAYRQKTGPVAYKTAMDQFAMGVNLQIGNRPQEVAEPLDAFIARMSYLLRHGRHVADVAVLYPIAALQSAYYFATPPSSNRPGSAPQFYWALEGGLIPPEIDYMDLGEMLYRGLRIDYTYVHPEVLTGRTKLEGGRLVLDNRENHEQFRVLIVPGGDTISADVARRITEFYRAGGAVIATHKLPERAAEFNRDAEVRAMVGEVFGFPTGDPMTAEIRPLIDDFKNYFAHSNATGGRAYFLPQPDIRLLAAVLREVIPTADVDIQMPPMWPVKMGPAYDGAFTYIHKVKDGRDIYFFANSQDTAVATKVALRGRHRLALWNPQTGERTALVATVSEGKGEPTTVVELKLAPVSAAFLVED